MSLRTARDQYLAHLGKIGTGDIALLAQEIEKEKERSKEAAMLVPGIGEERGISPAVNNGAGGGDGPGKVESKDGEGDVKMEER